MLARLAVDQAVIDRELAATGAVRCAKTRCRVVLGVMTDFAFLLGVRARPGDALVDEALRLADAPCSPIKMERP